LATLLAVAVVGSGCSVHRGYRWVKIGDEAQETVRAEQLTAEARLVSNHIATLQVWATQRLERRMVEVWKQMESRKRLTWFWVGTGIGVALVTLFILLIVALSSVDGDGGGSSWDFDDD
jgi:hypothetical protein